MHWTENTHLLHKGKYHCLADLLFVWFGFNQTFKSVSNSIQSKQLNPNQSNRRSAVHWFIPLRNKNKWVFSALENALSLCLYTSTSTVIKEMCGRNRGTCFYQVYGNQCPVAKRFFATPVPEKPKDSKLCPFLSEMDKKDQLVKPVQVLEDVYKNEQEKGKSFCV